MSVENSDHNPEPEDLLKEKAMGVPGNEEGKIDFPVITITPEQSKDFFDNGGGTVADLFRFLGVASNIGPVVHDGVTFRTDGEYYGKLYTGLTAEELAFDGSISPRTGKEVPEYDPNSPKIEITEEDAISLKEKNGGRYPSIGDLLKARGIEPNTGLVRFRHQGDTGWIYINTEESHFGEFYLPENENLPREEANDNERSPGQHIEEEEADETLDEIQLRIANMAVFAIGQFCKQYSGEVNSFNSDVAFHFTQAYATNGKYNWTPSDPGFKRIIALTSPSEWAEGRFAVVVANRIDSVDTELTDKLNTMIEESIGDILSKMDKKKSDDSSRPLINNEQV